MLNQIDRLVKLGSYERLIERLLPLAECRSGQAAEAMSQPECAASAAIGLALRRCCELTYRPTPLARRLAGHLARLQRPDGLFGEGALPSVGASAIALHALTEWCDLCAQAGIGVERLDERIEGGIDALRKLQGEDGLLDDDPVGSAIALSVLGAQPRFRAMINTASLVAAVSRSGAVSAELHSYAHAKAA